jgi:hypothetical protein
MRKHPYKSSGHVGLFDKEETSSKLSKLGSPIDTMLKDKGLISQIIDRAFRGKPLTEEQKTNNSIKSKVHCRVEHAFGFVSNSMNDFYIRSIGFLRAKGIIGLINLVYNLCRYEQIVRLNLLPIKC